MAFASRCIYTNVYGIEGAGHPTDGFSVSAHMGLSQPNRTGGITFGITLARIMSDIFDPSIPEVRQIWSRSWSLRDVIIAHARSLGGVPPDSEIEGILSVRINNFGRRPGSTQSRNNFHAFGDFNSRQGFNSEAEAEQAARDTLTAHISGPSINFNWIERVDEFRVHRSYSIQGSGRADVTTFDDWKVLLRGFGIDLDTLPYVDIGDFGQEGPPTLAVPSLTETASVECEIINLNEPTISTTVSITSPAPTETEITITTVDGDPSSAEIARLDARIDTVVSGLSTHFSGLITDLNTRISVMNDRIRELEEE